MAKMTPYVVKQGDHLALVAHRLGFVASRVWNDPANARLREIRPDPNILAVGDILYVPEQQPRWFRVPLGTTKTFVASRAPKIEVTVKLAVKGKPCANEDYRVRAGATILAGTTDPDGTVRIEVPVLTTEATIFLVKRAIHFPVRIGHLDPIDTLSGLRQRLRHLGLMTGEAESEEEATHRAIARLQAKQKLTPTGRMDEETRKALLAAHGS